MRPSTGNNKRIRRRYRDCTPLSDHFALKVTERHILYRHTYRKVIEAEKAYNVNKSLTKSTTLSKNMCIIINSVHNNDSKKNSKLIEIKIKEHTAQNK